MLSFLMCYAVFFLFPIAVVLALFRLGQALLRYFRARAHPSTGIAEIQANSVQTTPKRVTTRTQLALFAQWALTLIPVPLAYLALFLMAHRAQQLLGHWPEMMVNDPKWIGTHDALYQRYSDFADGAMGFLDVSVVFWVGLFIGYFRTYSAKQREALAWAYYASWFVFLCDFGQMQGWYID